MRIIANIKTRNVVKGTIKTLDKGKVASEKTKDNIVNIKEKGETVYNNESDNNVNEYATNKISNASKVAVVSSNKIKNKGIESVKTTKENYVKAKTKIKSIKTKLTEKRKVNKSIKGIKTSSKVAKKEAIKVAKETVKASERARKLAIATAKKTYQGIKLAVKATISAIKGIIAGTKALISALIAGGWVALVVIIVICLVGLLCSSIFGIFFSSENTGNNKTMNQVITEINNEMSNKIKDIQDKNIHDEYTMDSDRAEWKEVLTIYTAKVSNGLNETEVITLDDEKVKTLKDIFWKMNSVSYEVKTETKENEFESEIPKKILHITISSKSVDEMMNMYFFNQLQRQQIKDLLSDEYSMMWSSVIFGTSVGSPDIVKIALSQVGNVGGEPYWSWYGYKRRAEWCCIFVSWVAYQAGYIQTGVIPKFAGVNTGINWFKAMGQWKDKGFTPKGGDIIFFDWESDGTASHVGIVEKVENGRVYTIEGNSTDDMCRQKNYSLNSKVILGYGTPQY